MSSQQPLAWAFYDERGEIRFIIHDQKRMELWSKGYEHKIVPLYEHPQSQPNH